jgi:hypothetical protein
MNRTRRLLTVLFALVVSGSLLSAQSPEERAAARDVLKKWQDTVVNVRIVLKTRMSMGGREMQATEETVDAVATVIEPDGLAVMSLSTLNPAGMMNRIMGQAGGGSDEKFQMTSEPTDLKIRLADGREIPAKIVLRDEDLDLAFISRSGTKAGRSRSSRLSRFRGWGGSADGSRRHRSSRSTPSSSVRAPCTSSRGPMALAAASARRCSCSTASLPGCSSCAAWRATGSGCTR